jgi:hypothetical protein
MWSDEQDFAAMVNLNIFLEAPRRTKNIRIFSAPADRRTGTHPTSLQSYSFVKVFGLSVLRPSAEIRNHLTETRIYWEILI